MTMHNGGVTDEAAKESPLLKHSALFKFAAMALIVAAALVGVAFFLQHTTRNIKVPTGADATPPMERLVTQNYEVQAVGPAVNRDFLGSTLAISAGGRVHTCAGLTVEKLEAKEPLTCKDGYVVQPKK